MFLPSFGGKITIHHPKIFLIPGINQYIILLNVCINEGIIPKVDWMLITSRFLVVFIVSIIFTISCEKDPTGPSVDTHEIQGITFAKIPRGSFYMGDIQNYGLYSQEKPVHFVSLPSFLMSIYEITQEQYQSVMDSNPAYFKFGDNYPVESVSWYDAMNFCNKLSDMAGFERCYNDTTYLFSCDFSKNGFRLPTEAEWEYACRVGTETEYYTGNDLGSDGWTSTDLDVAGWYDGNSDNKTHSVGQKVPNAWGLYDMHGNVWEWCNDWYDSKYYSLSPSYDPTGPSSVSNRVLRGGGWNNSTTYCRSASRFGDNPALKLNILGFRVVRRP